jgi:type II secretory pathway pseudopilin PulG
MNREGWILVKLLLIITGVLIFVYLITPKFQKSIYQMRDLATESNLESIRVALLSYYKDKEEWPSSLSALKPGYLKDVPREFLSSIKGSSKVSTVKKDTDFISQRKALLEGWIYGNYDQEGDSKYGRSVLPMSTVFSDGKGDTSSW